MNKNEELELARRARVRRNELELQKLRGLADFFSECPVCGQCYPPVPIIERFRRISARIHFLRERLEGRIRRCVHRRQ